MQEQEYQHLLHSLQQAQQHLLASNAHKANQILLPLLHKNKLNANMLRRIIILLVHHNNNHESASTYFQYYFKNSNKTQDDDEVEMLLIFAQFLYKKNLVQQAKEQYLKTFEITQQNSSAHYQYAVFLIHNYSSPESQKQALHHLQSAIQHLEANGSQQINQTHQYYIEYARLLANTHNHQKARNIYKLVLDHLQKIQLSALSEQYVEYLYEYGLIEKYLGNCTQAKKALQKCISYQESSNISVNPYHLLSQAQVLVGLNETNEALLCYQKCLDMMPDDIQTLHRYGLLLGKMGKYAMAINVMDQCIRLQPNNINNYYNYILILLKAQKIPKCLQILQTAFTQPKLSQNPQLLALYAHIQVQYYQNYHQAAQIYKRCSQQHPENIQNLYHYAKILIELKRYQQSENLLLKIVGTLQEQKYREDVSGLYEKVLNIYAVLLTQNQRYGEAEDKFKEFLSINSRSSETLYNYGLMFCNMAKFPQAYTQFERAHEIQPQNPLFFLMMGIVLYEQHKIEQATLHFDQANKLLSQQHQSQQFDLSPNNSDKVILNKKRYGLKAFQIKFIRENLNYYMQMIQQYNQYKNKKKKSRQSSTLSTNQSSHQQIQQISNNFIELLVTATIQPKKPQQKNQPEWKTAMQMMKQQMMEQIKILHEENKQLKRELTQKIVQIQRDVAMVKRELFWNEGLDQKLELLEVQRKMRAHSYGRKMCWMLCSSIQTYRSLNLGIVGAGSEVIYSKTGAFIQKVSSVCDFVADFPVIGQTCGIISKITGLYVEQEQQIVIQKVIQATNRYYQQRLLSKAATQTVQYLLSDIRHIEILQNPKDNSSIIQNFQNFLNKKKTEILTKFLDINLKEDEKQALVDCSVIIAYLIKNDDFGENQNVLKTAAVSMLNAKLEEKMEEDLKAAAAQNKRQLRDENTVKKVPVASGGCCAGNDCSIM